MAVFGQIVSVILRENPAVLKCQNAIDMNTAQLIKQLTGNHRTAAAFIVSLDETQYMLAHNGKWTAGQQLAHLLLCLQPISQALNSAQFIREKFGSIDRQRMSYDEVMAAYKTGLQQGGKAPERFVPPVSFFNERDMLYRQLDALLSVLEQQLQGYSDTELDTLVLPHPFLGLLTIRELLYLMSYHPLHHLQQVKANLQQASA